MYIGSSYRKFSMYCSMYNILSFFYETVFKGEPV